MNRTKHILFSIVFILIASSNSLLFAQKDSLPEFSVKERSGVVLIGWNNPYKDITQLIIQRSYDSIGSFKSIMSMPDPAAVSNGYADKKEGAGKMYYRIFYVLPGGRYTFTASRKPSKYLEEIVIEKPIKVDVQADSIKKNILAIWNDLDSVGKKQMIKMIGREERKSEIVLTPINTITADLLNHRPIIEPSAFIFTNEDGNLILLLPDAEKKGYDLNVYKEDGKTVFKMKNIKERFLLLDKSNFYQSGWFKFELFIGDKLKDKNRFFIPPENN